MKLSHHALANTTANNIKAVISFLLVEEQPLIRINMTVLIHDLSQLVTRFAQRETELVEPQTVFCLFISLHFRLSE